MTRPTPTEADAMTTDTTPTSLAAEWPDELRVTVQLAIWAALEGEGVKPTPGMVRVVRADVEETLVASLTPATDERLAEMLGEWWDESRRYIYDATPERREKQIVRFQPRILAALANREQSK